MLSSSTVYSHVKLVVYPISISICPVHSLLGSPQKAKVWVLNVPHAFTLCRHALLLYAPRAVCVSGVSASVSASISVSASASAEKVSGQACGEPSLEVHSHLYSTTYLLLSTSLISPTTFCSEHLPQPTTTEIAHAITSTHLNFTSARL